MMDKDIWGAIALLALFGLGGVFFSCCVYYAGYYRGRVDEVRRPKQEDK